MTKRVAIIVRRKQKTGETRGGKWQLEKCEICDGWGRLNVKRKQITPEQAKAWGYDSILCPECDGAGYLKETTYLGKIGDVILE